MKTNKVKIEFEKVIDEWRINKYQWINDVYALIDSEVGLKTEEVKEQIEELIDAGHTIVCFGEKKIRRKG